MFRKNLQVMRLALSATVLAGLCLSSMGVASADTLGKDSDRLLEGRDLPRMERLAGEDRVATALLLARSFRDWGDTAVLVSGDGFADALSAVPYAATLRAPVLLTGSEGLDSRLEGYLQRKFKKVTIIGGEQAVAQPVQARIADLGIDAVRIAGKDRYQTSLLVARRTLEARKTAKTRVFVAGGADFADGLSAGPAAFHRSGVLLLFAPDGPSPEQRSFIDLNAASVSAIGGPAVKAAQSLTQDVTPVRGTDRYETAVKTAMMMPDKPLGVVVASGQDYPDALAAGVPAALAHQALLLTPKDEMDKSVSGYLEDNRPVLSGAPVNVIGGYKAVSLYVASWAERLSLGRLNPLNRWHPATLGEKPETKVANPVYQPYDPPRWVTKKRLRVPGIFKSETKNAKIVEVKTTSPNPNLYAQINDGGELEIYEQGNVAPGTYNFTVRVKATRNGLDDSETLEITIPVTLP